MKWKKTEDECMFFTEDYLFDNITDKRYKFKEIANHYQCIKLKNKEVLIDYLLETFKCLDELFDKDFYVISSNIYGKSSDLQDNICIVKKEDVKSERRVKLYQIYEEFGITNIELFDIIKELFRRKTQGNNLKDKMYYFLSCIIPFYEKLFPEMVDLYNFREMKKILEDIMYLGNIIP